MRDNLIEITDERGVEFYFAPFIGKHNKNKYLAEYIFTLNYLNNMIEGMGFQSNRIGFNSDIITMATFISDIIIKFQQDFNDVEDDDFRV